LLFFVFPKNQPIRRVSGVFISFSLVYTNILEQKRIAGQAQNSFILILFAFF